MTKKIYASLDVAKYVMALMILLGHVSNEWAHITGIWHYILSCDFTVPAFFSISGFLFFNKIEQLETKEERNQYYKKWSIRVWKMYLVWSLIYLLLVFTGWCIYGVTEEKILSSIHRWALFSTYSTIWFLPALWVGGSIIYILYSHTNWKQTLIITGLLWMIGVIMGPYSDLFSSNIVRDVHNIYMSIFFTFRNGVFYGSVYFLVGYYCLKFMGKISFWKSTMAFLLCYILFFIEAVVMHRLVQAPDTDMAAFMLPSVFFLIIALAQFELKPRPIYTTLRNQSMLIFCGQRLFLTAIPSLAPMLFAGVKEWPSLPIMLFFCVPVVLFAFITDKLSVKYRFLTYLR